MLTYPKVKHEFETLDMVLAGKSISRFGDGEFQIVGGGNCVSQVYDRKLSEEMKAILHSNSKSCIVGIPRLAKESPKYLSWKKYERSYPRFLREGKTYYSSFVTRTDSAPWCDTAEFFDKVESLWRDQEVALVYGTDRSLSPRQLTSARRVVEVTCNRRDAYIEIDRLEKEVVKSGVKRALLCAGATATVLAYRLSNHGIHALDLGHIGFMPRAKDWGKNNGRD